MTNVIPLQTARNASTPADLFLRVGETHYGQVASLYAEGKLPVRRAIFEASKIKHQVDFIKTLRDDKVELTLDTKAAELAALTRYQGNPSGAPWADGTLHLPQMFDDMRCQALAEHIAEVAIERGFDRVLSPSHLLREGLLDPWFVIDKRLCEALRKALDQSGGAHIAIDYNLIIEERPLRDEAVRSALLHQLGALPFENLVLRASHFGADVEATKLRAFINMLDRLMTAGRPVIVDHVGGLVGRALLAFGVASGIAHGLDEHLRFDGAPWSRLPKENDKEDEGRGGAAKRISIPLLDRSLTVPELTALANAKGGQRLVCADRNCCRSLADMINHSKRHSIFQETKALAALSSVPDLMRTQHFLDKEMADADRFARQIKELNPVAADLKPRRGQSHEQAAESLSARLSKQSLRNEKMRASLENLHSVRGLAAPRIARAHMAERVRAGGRL
jgi:hypothetical protein